MKESSKLTTIIHASPQAIYQAWLDSEKHSQMTGGIAQCSNEVGGGFLHGTDISVAQMFPWSLLKKLFRNGVLRSLPMMMKILN